MSRRLSFWSNPLIRIFGAISLLALLFSVVWFLPKAQVSSLPLPADRIQAEIAARDVLVKAIGGLLVFITAFVSVKNLRVTEEKQIAERFSKAVEMLGHEENVHIRLGGIYALERIAMDSKKDHYPVMQVLAAFIRTKASIAQEQRSDDLHKYDEFSLYGDCREDEQESLQEALMGGRSSEELERDAYAGDYKYFVGTLNESYVPNQSIDVQAAVSAIGRRDLGDSSSYLLDLGKILLEGIVFEGNYENISFYKAHFKGCIFGTRLEKEKASFRDNNFREANFEKVEFKHSDFRKAHFNNSVFISTTFKDDADFTEAHLTETQFSGGTKICGCKFIRADWTNSNIGGQIKVPVLKSNKTPAQRALFMARSEVKNTDITGVTFTGAKIVSTLFEECTGGDCQKTSFKKAKLSDVTFKNFRLNKHSFIGAQIGHESKFSIDDRYGHEKSRKSHQENYSDQVNFVKAGIRRADLEEGKATIIEANFS